MHQLFKIKRGDTAKSIRLELLPATITLAGAQSVRLKLQRIGGPTVIDEPVTIISDLPPVVQYDWQSGDTEVAGAYQAEVKAVYSDGTIETFPDSGFAPIEITPNIPDL